MKLKEFKKKNKFDKVILFGSFARGDFKNDSDVDVIIVDKRFKRMDYFKRGNGLWLKWHIEHKIKYPVDFICYSPEEFDKLKKKVSIVSEALREGIIIE
ncbi:MAG: nucleotidyltransferase domain-containing protein [Candidatus Aenigmatarchaeota archaeon]